MLLKPRGRRNTLRMAKLYFNYSTMNAGKSTVLLQAAHNYVERGMVPYLLTAQFDNRSGEGRIASRIGCGARAARILPTITKTRNILSSLAATLPNHCGSRK